MSATSNTTPSNSLALVGDKSKAVVQPKPTKTEILEALVEVRMQEIHKENEENEKKREALEKKLKPAVMRYMKQSWDKLAKVYSFGSPVTKWDAAKQQHVPTGKWQGLEVKLDIDCPAVEGAVTLPAELQAMLSEYKSIPAYKDTSDWSRNELRKKLRTQLAGRGDSGIRVKALVNHPSSRKALTALLNQITSVPVTTTSTITV